MGSGYMPEEVARGRSLDGILQDYSQAWGCEPEDIKVEVLEKPGLLSRLWKVHVSWNPGPLNQDDATSGDPAELQKQACIVQWNEEEKKYSIELAEPVKFVVPYPLAGELYRKGQVQEATFMATPGEILEFSPFSYPGQLTWEFAIRDQGLNAVALVTHQKSGSFTLPEGIPADVTIRFENFTRWVDAQPEGEFWDEKKFMDDLRGSGIIHGVHPLAWSQISEVQGSGEVIVAEGTPPIPSSPAHLEDYVGAVQQQDLDDERIDFFASKVKLVHEGEVLARKIPGTPGAAGKDVRGQEIPSLPPKDFQFELKKNVHLSEDGLEVIASAAGLPVRTDETSYRVENIYVLNQDVDLASGSIEFPGDVFISGNVLDGLHIYSGGKVEIGGSTSKAEIRAEKGLTINHNVIAGKLVVGERFVVRSELLRRVQELHEELTTCLMHTNELINSPNAKALKPGQCLKILLERRFAELPKMAVEVEKFILGTKDELINQDLILAVRTTKRFLAGLGPLEPQAIPFLERMNIAFEQLIFNISLEVPEKLKCTVEYVQGATVECGGAFECRKGTYNSNIRADGDLRIDGVCRGGKVTSGGNVEIKELGGSGVSITTVQFRGTKRLKVGFCHPNVMIIIDKEIIRIEEAYRSLEVYREMGRVQVERLRGN